MRAPNCATGPLGEEIHVNPRGPVRQFGPLPIAPSLGVSASSGMRPFILLMAGFVLGLPSPARADWMLSAYLGAARTQPSTARLDQPAQQTSLEFIDLHYRGESSRPRRYYGYRIAWIPRSRHWMAIEAEHVHAKVFAETEDIGRLRGTLHAVPIDTSQKVSLVVQELSMSHGLNFIFGNFVMRREFGARHGAGRRATAAIRIGAGPTVPHAESTINGVSRQQYEYGGIGAQVGAGVEVAVWRGVHVLGEYKFTGTTARISVDDGEAVIPARSHHGVAGVAVRF